MSLTIVSSNIAGYTKKQLTAAVVFIGFCIGNAVGPQTFIAKQARRFPLPFRSINTYATLFCCIRIRRA
jgi:hypothetical protein